MATGVFWEEKVSLFSTEKVPSTEEYQTVIPNNKEVILQQWQRNIDKKKALTTGFPQKDSNLYTIRKGIEKIVLSLLKKHPDAPLLCSFFTLVNNCSLW